MMGEPAADVIVVGGGLIGRWVAWAVAATQGRVVLIEAQRPGAASPVGAGMLAPSVERTAGVAQTFLVAARDRYPDEVAALAEATGITVPLALDGILDIAADETDAARRQAAARGDTRWLSADDVRQLDPGYAAPWGAAWHTHDGAVDPLPMLAALDAALAAAVRIRRVSGEVAALRPDGVTLRDGTRLDAPTTVLCGGTWSGTVAGLTRPIPVFPIRGQMLDLPSRPVRLVAYGAGGYLVPRADGRTYVGATMEDVGFDASVTDEGAQYLRTVAATLAPALAGVAPIRHAAALRPMTPDHLPLLGPDPDLPGRWYACGHGRNGILLAPLTGRVVAAALSGRPLPYDLSPFSPARFA